MDKEIKDALAPAANALHDVTDLFKKLAGPLSEELGLMLGDKVKEYRVRNWIKVQKRVGAMLSASHVSPCAVPPRIFLPILESASIEDDPTLQEYWAALIANSCQKDVSPAFIHIIKELQPFEARALREIYLKVLELDAVARSLNQSQPDKLIGDERKMMSVGYDDPEPMRFAIRNFERLGLVRREFVAVRKMSPWIGSPFGDEELPVETTYFFTVFGLAFMTACTAPSIAHQEGKDGQL